MASIKMKNLRSFPMEKLCFDLKLEALEQMESWDIVELTKVNQGFQGRLVRDPSIVFGEHVSEIELCQSRRMRIEKFSNSCVMDLNVDPPLSHFSFVKKIRSCDCLRFGTVHQSDEKNILLKNLKSVNELVLAWDSKEDLEGFFSNFHASIKKEAELNIYLSAFNDQVIKDRIENFMVAPQLKDCEKISFGCRCRTEDSVRFCYNASSKAKIKNIYMRIYGSLELIVQQIITNGIPSKNPEAAIFLDSYNIDFTVDPSHYPGMRRIDGENRLWLLKQANDLVRSFGHSRYDGYDFFREENSMFLRRFDSTKDCIYVYDERYGACFLTFYVHVD